MCCLCGRGLLSTGDLVPSGRGHFEAEPGVELLACFLLLWSMGHRTLASFPALWATIPCPRSELRLDLVLASGQSFR